MILHRLYIGHHVRGSSGWTPEAVEAHITREATENGIDGYTLFDATGAWQGSLEPTTVVEILTDDHAAVRQLARTLKDQLRQDEILHLQFDIRA